MDIEEAKEGLKFSLSAPLHGGEHAIVDIKEVEVVLSELEKKEAIINEMSIYINSPLRIPEEKYCEFYNSDDDCCWKTDKECKDCIKEYFTKKVEGK